MASKGNETDKISDLDEDLARLRDALSFDLEMINNWCNAFAGLFVGPDGEIVFRNIDKDVRRVVPLMLAATGSSCNSILKLTDPPELGVRDAFILARSVIEGLINVCYILGEGSEAAKRAESHAKQKSVRDLDRSLEVSDFRISLRWAGADELEIDADLQSALDEFTSKKGREITEWAEDKLGVRLEKIAHRFGKEVEVRLVSAFFAIYRHASELSHGTFFGSLFFLGKTSPGDNSVEEIVRWHCYLILLALIKSIEAVGYCLHEVSSTPDTWEIWIGAKVDLKNMKCT